MRKTIIVAATALALAGCATTRPGQQSLDAALDLEQQWCREGRVDACDGIQKIEADIRQADQTQREEARARRKKVLDAISVGLQGVAAAAQAYANSQPQWSGPPQPAPTVVYEQPQIVAPPPQPQRLHCTIMPVGDLAAADCQ